MRKGSVVFYKGEKWIIVSIKHDYLGKGFILKDEKGKMIHVDSRNSHDIKEG